ncbi:MAG: nicotinate-nucleotide diphosphorylase (carboxylating) [Gammaproteobacteria bacterium]|nr:nicotinate-nucleotide diphosphorylase (carboxylating) [Gammaproteobacteria bacterium]|tara:strand:- start:1852 stop:2694 length:843 start_codon:yes stop_codon:yes gene_type:complete
MKLNEIISNDVKNAINEDLAFDDITTNLLKNSESTANASVICNEDTILSGKDWFEEVFIQISRKYKNNSYSINWDKGDGDLIKRNSIVCQIKCPIKIILSAERISLNFIQLMSGISTKVNNYCSLIDGTDVKILDTRKTIPNLRYAQKYAVKTGGGFNHRFSLNDQILLKENHLKVSGVSLDEFLTSHKSIMSNVSIEAESLDQVKIITKYSPRNILLDNFSVNDVKLASKIINKSSTIEVSGGINKDNILDYANSGIDYISIGDLTKNISATDFSLRIV